MKKKNFCLISAFYNEKENLPKFTRRLENTRLKLLKCGYSVSIVMVNDGSTDNSLNILRKLSKNKKYIKIINLTKNYGQQIAIYLALKNNKADLYGAIDSDGQQDPLLFIKMIKKLENKKLDIVQMKKKYGNYESLLKSIFSRIFYSIFMYLTNIDLQSGSSDFYLITKKVRREIMLSQISKFFLRGFIHSTGLPKVYLEYMPSKREKGKSKYSIYKQLDFALTAIYLYGTRLFVRIFIFSIILMLLSIFFIIFLIYEHYVLNVQVPGWATIAILITFFGAMNIFFICLITFFSIKMGNVLSSEPYHESKNN